jgi:hypothetical protein
MTHRLEHGVPVCRLLSVPAPAPLASRHFAVARKGRAVVAADDFESGIRGLSREKVRTASKTVSFGAFSGGMAVAPCGRQLEGQMLYLVIIVFGAAAFGYVKIRRQRKGATGH